jgi:hypothetical protein
MLPSIFITIAISCTLPALATDVSECNCGFQDDQTSSVYTDSLIVYFNETDEIDPAIFQAEDFAHKKEQGWNSLYKIGASSNNARFTNTTNNGSRTKSLEMVLDPANEGHLVNGASLQSTRRDIQHGLFEAAMKPAGQWTGGTVLSYGIYFNRSNNAGFGFMNSDKPVDAHVSNLVNGEWPAPDLVTNFTIMESAGLDPWNSFTDVHFSWNKSEVAFELADNTTRLVTKKQRTLPTAGQALQIKVWSIGDRTFGQGPPLHNASRSHILWVRAFFNSSAMTEPQHSAFDQRCAPAPRCLTSDVSLRGYTSYSPASQLPWNEPPKNRGIRTLAGVVAACCSSFGIIALMNVFLRRTPWRKLWPKTSYIAAITPSPAPTVSHSKATSIGSGSDEVAPITPISGAQTPLPLYGSQTHGSGVYTPAPSYSTAALSLHHTASLDNLATTNSSDQSFRLDDLPPSPRRIVFSHTKSDDGMLKKALHRISEMSQIDANDDEHCKPLDVGKAASKDANAITQIPEQLATLGEKHFHDPIVTVTEYGKAVATSVKSIEEHKNTAEVIIAPVVPTAAPTKRVDYLSGLTTVACIGVTLHHFGQTFWPFVIEGYGPTAHYPTVEHWLHIFVGGIILSNLWIGPFFLTATRFLSANYLKHGNLEDIAKKELRRAPRLFVPIIIISLLQYFLISMGLTSALQWLPSVTYSSWPYVVAQSNFAVYANNIVELAYQIPNSVPEILPHYCIGVLWTIPVQLQFTYVVLAATVVIRDIRNPRKRFGVYAVVILAGWYARVGT